MDSGCCDVLRERWQSRLIVATKFYAPDRCENTAHNDLAFDFGEPEFDLVLWKTAYHRDARPHETEAFIETSGADIVRGDA